MFVTGQYSLNLFLSYGIFLSDSLLIVNFYVLLRNYMCAG